MMLAEIVTTHTIQRAAFTEIETIAVCATLVLIFFAIAWGVSRCVVRSQK